ncbi:DUF2938 domain-containing protein [Sphingobacterium sp. UT-1RO-CII-1]|uniref:DUF2938 domain-containing protein n=1 Tax=Sphingobacterium sp. UT-1RO-CII-1 TaxID=2995225 RepID=UPI00227CD92A|nr:DUF2938 domain-containing protein [Sphingobacterium sp. UT-1RO-CII-1]MCY4779991.1 DUF2938 domain-containing protein [Sphingobacterium sp. UT-1RO-CII-1]
MNILFEMIGYALFIGITATLFMDIYAILVLKAFNIPSLDYAIVGRWLGYFKDGVFRHDNILKTEKVKGERLLGWLAHYVIGISFAFVLILICGIEWVHTPTFWPCLLVGLLTTVAPWFIMQPAFGFGIAAAKTPNPYLSRLRSLNAHAIYGIGLYIGAILLSMLI